MKLSIPEIRKEAFEIKTSIKNIKKMHAYQLGLVKADEVLEAARNGSLQEITKAQTLNDANYLEQSEKYVSDILGLTKKEIDKLEELERSEFTSIQSKVTLALQGYGEAQIEAIFKEENESAEKKALV